MEKYEYYTMTFETKGLLGGQLETKDFDRELNRLGSEGWELVSSLATTQSYGSSRNVVCIFKRKK